MISYAQTFFYLLFLIQIMYNQQNANIVTKYAFCCILNDRQGALDDFISNYTIKL